ncbi:cohesin domain-containing protein [Rhodohalobacter sp. 8-1]|uniref:cohesin domain-containing protein n=1 Tax=Rhodohalobacter sp. 8-1 TaxID=3131972 RepID=UPI0030ED3641
MFIKRLTFILFLTLSWAASGVAQQITISMPDTAVDAGSEIEIPVNVTQLTEADGVVSGEWEFTTSSGMVSLVDVDATGALLEGRNLLFNSTTGRLAFAGTDTLTGSGTLFTLTVQVDGEATKFQEADIGFRNTQLNEGNPGVTTEGGTVRIRGISINPQTPRNAIVEGTTFQFNLEGDAVAPVTWSTSNNSVAQINSDGLLSAQTPGTIRVYAEDSNGLKDSTSLFRIEPESLLDLTMSVGDESITQTLEGTVTISITDITGLDIQSGQFELTFPSNKIDILSFDTQGTILEGSEPTTYIDGNLISVAFANSDPFSGAGDLLKINVQIPRNASGEATITPQNILFNESIEAMAQAGTITINDAPVPEITPLQAELTIGDTQQFSVESGGTAPFTWSSSDSEVASIDPSTGQLEAVSRGVTEITATDADNFSSEVAEVIVNDITMTISEYSLSDGGSVSVPLEVMDVTGLGIYSYEIEIEYDPSVVAFDVLDASGSISDGISTSASAENGVVTIAAASASPLEGSGSLTDVVFKRSESPGSEQETDLTLKRVQFNEPGPDAPTATRINGSISVEGVSWTGNGDGSSWDDPANWSSTAVPGTDSDILIGLNPGNSYTITVPGDVTVNSILLSSPTAELSIQDSMSVLTSYIQSGGTLGGPGAVSVTGQLTWNSGTMSGAGTVYPLNGMEISGSGGKVLNAKTLIIPSETELTLSGSNLTGENGGLLKISENALLNLTGDNGSSLSQTGTGGATLRNLGNIQKNSGSGSISVGWALDNSGSISINEANSTLRFTGPVTDNNGSYHSASGSLEFNTNGTYSFSDGSTITAAPEGTIRFGTSGDGNSDITLSGTYNVNGTTEIRSSGDGIATVTFPATADVTSIGGSGLIIGGSQGELFLESNTSVTIGTLVLNAGGYLSLSSDLTVTDSYEQNHQTATLESDFDVTVDGTFTWSGGTMAGSGTTFATNGISISGSNESNTKVLDTRNLSITAGTIDYRGDRFFAGNGSTFLVGENAEMDLRPTNETTTMSVLSESSEAPLFLNEGLINSIANNNVLTVNWELENSGTLDLGNNMLVIDAPNGLLNRGTINGSGNIIADVMNNSGGLVQPGSATEIGQLQIQGNLTQSPQSTIALKIAGTTAGSTYDQIRASNVALAGTLSVELLNDFTPGQSDRFQSLVWPGGSRTGNFTQFEGMETGSLTLAIRFLDGLMEIYDGSFGSTPGAVSINVTVTTPPFQRAGRDVPIEATIQNSGGASMQRIRVENFDYGVSSSPGPNCPTNDAYENLKCRMEQFGVTPPPPEDGMEEEYPFLPQQRFPQAIGSGGGGGEGTEFTSVTSGGSSFGISGSKVCENEPVNPVVKAGMPVTGADLNKCAYEIAKLALEFVPGADCFKLGAGIATSIGEGFYDKQFDIYAHISANVVGAINCAGDAVPATKAIKVMKKLNDLASGAGGIKGVSEACSNSAGGGSVSASGSSSTTCIGSFDPNDKVGPSGVLDNRYIASGDSLPYVVFFENKAEATAAAQTVIIKDTLDTSVFNVDTFSFGMIAWSDTSISMESNVLTTSKDVDLRPAMDLILRIEADLDETTGVLSWVFKSLDPETMEPTLDPLAGFLPPNETSPEGEGLVSYYVSTNEGTPSNTTFGNSARIIFDENDPIDTPVWSNTLDIEAPVSSVQSLDSLQTETDFSVSWSGDDDASGTELYNVYVSEDGGEFSIWQEETTETSATFTGENGKTYEFFSQAIDYVGNEEDRWDEADVQTEVQIGTTVEPSSGIPGQFVLEQNYPNPFNPTTTIQFGLPEAGDVSLEVFDMTGRRVATLVNENKSAGWHNVTFDASNLASGMYIYRIQSGNFISTRKLTLIK